jgi:hypothetical protein
MEITAGFDGTPEGELLKTIFGLRTPEHPYLRCRECGAEYFKRRPAYCKGCGYAGGAIECVPLCKITRIMRKELKDEYEAAVEPYKVLLFKETDIVAAMKYQVKKLEERIRERARTLALLLCAFQELTGE